MLPQLSRHALSNDIFECLCYAGMVPTTASDATPPSICFYRYVGKIGLNTSHLLNGSGIGTDNPAVSLDIESTDAIRIPTG